LTVWAVTVFNIEQHLLAGGPGPLATLGHLHAGRHAHAGYRF
jgi:hypothetical protein